jgi:hypothetical protein
VLQLLQLRMCVPVMLLLCLRMFVSMCLLLMLRMFLYRYTSGTEVKGRCV